jgi:single-stranded-DNA-specific exonuclease
MYEIMKGYTKMSEHAKIWNVKSDVSLQDERVSEIARELKLSPITATLLINRGYTTPEQARKFIRMETEMLHSPFDLLDMDAAIKRIKQAIDNCEKIVIYGDYDVDGVTSVSALYLYLKSKGGNMDFYIPNRMKEGYGMSPDAIDSIIDEKQANLIITVDTGITAIEEIEYAKSRGVDVVVTDHHEVRGDIPRACAVVNPKRDSCAYPFKELAGVGVVFKLICAFEIAYYCEGRSEFDCVSGICREYCDLVAVGTIADVMPVKDENRLIVSYGLKLIAAQPRRGLAELIDASMQRNLPAGMPEKKPLYEKKPKITSGFIGYTIAPRINAAGRIADATCAVKLFITDSHTEVEVLAEELCSLNRDRQNEENLIAQSAFEMIEEGYDFDKYPIIVLQHDGWHQGIVGIVASRITEHYGKPAILVSFDKMEESEKCDDDIGKGSGRSVRGLNLVDALHHCSDTLTKYGGHELAAGLSLRRGDVDAFREKINEYARENFSQEQSAQSLDADCELSPEDMTLELCEQVRLLEPYGVSNPTPVFIAKDLEITEITPISGGKHTRVIFTKDKSAFTAMCFSKTAFDLGIFVGERADVLFNLDINEFRGQKNLQMILRDIRPSEQSRLTIEAEREKFKEIKGGAHFNAEDNFLPGRNDLNMLYKTIVTEIRLGHDTLTHRALMCKVNELTGNESFNYVKLKFAMLILKEMNLFGIDESIEEVYTFTQYQRAAKADLEKSAILRGLRAQMNK